MSNLTTYARIDDHQVIELFETDEDIAGMFHPDLVWLECGADVRPGWKWNEVTGFGPPAVTSIQQRRDAVWRAIQSERDARSRGGGYLVDGHWFHSDTFSRLQQLALKELGAGIPAGVRWKTMSGAFVPMTAALAQAVFSAAVLSDIAVFGAAESHRAAMEASPEPEGYDFSGGWPAIFGE